MEYIKFNIDEMNQSMVFFEYRDISNGEKGPMLRRAIPLDKIGEVEPKILELVAGDVIGIYYEKRGPIEVTEKQYLDRVETLDEEVISFAHDIVKKACINEAFDELLKPPTIDEQVEDFIKEFFEDSDNEDLSQQDLLADFFNELEEDNKPLEKQINEEFDNSTAESKDFLADFFAEIEEDKKTK